MSASALNVRFPPIIAVQADCGRCRKQTLGARLWNVRYGEAAERAPMTELGGKRTFPDLSSPCDIRMLTVGRERNDPHREAR